DDAEKFFDRIDWDAIDFIDDIAAGEAAPLGGWGAGFDVGNNNAGKIFREVAAGAEGRGEVLDLDPNERAQVAAFGDFFLGGECGFAIGDRGFEGERFTVAADDDVRHLTDWIIVDPPQKIH